jgi:hypothetical protein
MAVSSDDPVEKAGSHQRKPALRNELPRPYVRDLSVCLA